MQKRFIFLMAMLLTISLTAVAQITTSSLAGQVTFEGSDEAITNLLVNGVNTFFIRELGGTRA